MSFNPLKLLVYCKSLCNNQPQNELETLTRIIVSRVYYSVFLHSREYLKEKRNTRFIGDGTDHILVENQVKKVDRSLGSMVRTLRQNRLAADYTLQNPARIRTGNRNKKRDIHFDKNLQNQTLFLAEYVTNNLSRN